MRRNDSSAVFSSYFASGSSFASSGVAGKDGKVDTRERGHRWDGEGCHARPVFVLRGGVLLQCVFSITSFIYMLYKVYIYINMTLNRCTYIMDGFLSSQVT